MISVTAPPIVPGWVYEGLFPQANEDQLAALSKAWNQQAKGCSSDSDSVRTVFGRLVGSWQGEDASAAIARSKNISMLLTTTAQTCSSLSEGCSDASNAVTATKLSMNLVLNRLAEETQKLVSFGAKDPVAFQAATTQIRVLQMTTYTIMKAYETGLVSHLGSISMPAEVAPRLPGMNSGGAASNPGGGGAGGMPSDTEGGYDQEAGLFPPDTDSPVDIPHLIGEQRHHEMQNEPSSVSPESQSAQDWYEDNEELLRDLTSKYSDPSSTSGTSSDDPFSGALQWAKDNPDSVPELGSGNSTPLTPNDGSGSGSAPLTPSSPAGGSPSDGALKPSGAGSSPTHLSPSSSSSSSPGAGPAAAGAGQQSSAGSGVPNTSKPGGVESQAPSTGGGSSSNGGSSAGSAKPGVVPQGSGASGPVNHPGAGGPSHIDGPASVGTGSGGAGGGATPPRGGGRLHHTPPPPCLVRGGGGAAAPPVPTIPSGMGGSGMTGGMVLPPGMMSPGGAGFGAGQPGGFGAMMGPNGGMIAGQAGINLTSGQHLGAGGPLSAGPGGALGATANGGHGPLSANPGHNGAKPPSANAAGVGVPGPHGGANGESSDKGATVHRIGGAILGAGLAAGALTPLLGALHDLRLPIHPNRTLMQPTQFGLKDVPLAPLPLGMGVVLQKVLAPGEADAMMSGTVRSLRGLVYPRDQVTHLKTPAMLFQTLGLGYVLEHPTGQQTLAFDPDAMSIEVLRCNGVRQQDLVIPLDEGVNHPPSPFRSVVRDHARPWLGMGEAPGSTTSYPIEEFEILGETAIAIPHLAEIWRLDADGSEHHIATYNARSGLWSGTKGEVAVIPGRKVDNGLYAIMGDGSGFESVTLSETNSVLVAYGLAAPTEFQECSDGSRRLVINNHEIDDMVGVTSLAAWRDVRVQMLYRHGDSVLVDYADTSREVALALGFGQIAQGHWLPQWVPFSELVRVRESERGYPVPRPAPARP